MPRKINCEDIELSTIGVRNSLPPIRNINIDRRKHFIIRFLNIDDKIHLSYTFIINITFWLVILIYGCIYFNVTQKNVYFANLYNDPMFKKHICYLLFDGEVSKFFMGICPFSNAFEGTVKLYIHSFSNNDDIEHILYIDNSTRLFSEKSEIKYSSGIKVSSSDAIIYYNLGRQSSCSDKCLRMTKYCNIKNDLTKTTRIFAEMSKNTEFLYNDCGEEVIMWQHHPHENNFDLYLIIFIIANVIFVLDLSIIIIRLILCCNSQTYFDYVHPQRTFLFVLIPIFITLGMIASFIYFLYNFERFV